MNTSAALDRIRTEFPGLEWSNCRRLNSGADNIILILDEKLLFRIPKDDTDKRRFSTQLRVLDALRKRVGVAIPRFDYVSHDRTFGGGPLLPGVRLTPARLNAMGQAHRKSIAEQFGSFLAAIHSFPVSSARNLGVQEADKTMFRDLARDWVQWFERLRPQFSPAERRALVRHLACITARRHRFSPVLAHCDMWYDHFFFDPTKKTLSGIADFDMELQDPAEDFFGFWDYGEDLLDSVLSAYGRSDSGLKSRSKDYWVQRRMGALFAGITENRKRWIRYGSTLFKHR